MLTVAYLANQFPSAVEPYVVEEIVELRRRGVQVIPGSVRRPAANEDHHLGAGITGEPVVLVPLEVALLLRAACLCLFRVGRVSDLLLRILLRGRESPWQRAKALLHTWLGACYAVRLQDLGVAHIHAHHGYFGSWVAMVAAHLLGVSFSMTLHGSDLLLHAVYLDAKLEHCTFCITISDYNRRYILEHHPQLDSRKVIVSRLGVELPDLARCYSFADSTLVRQCSRFTMLAVGRLHAVKDYAFLLRACRQLLVRGVAFECSIAGAGPERRNLEALIRKYGLENCVTLLGHVPREQMPSLYRRADVVVLTSISEGIPLVLMEAMAQGKVVLAPAITGIPELVVPGRTGFLYDPGSLGDFVARLLLIHSLMQTQERSPRRGVLSAARQLDWVRHGARTHVLHAFNRKSNLESFGNSFLERVHPPAENLHEDLVLQQV